MAWGHTANAGLQAEGPRGTGHGPVFAARNPFAALKPDDSISAWGMAASSLRANGPSGSGHNPIVRRTNRVVATHAAGGAATASFFEQVTSQPPTLSRAGAPGNSGAPFDLVILSPELAGSVPQEELAGARVVILDANRDAISQVGAALQANPGASVVREFRVYNSRLIPRLFATTFKTAPLPKLHGVSW
jgi:hypothetical protein